MQRRIEGADFVELAQVWSSCYPAKYRVSAELLRANVLDSPLTDFALSSIVEESGRVEAFLVIKNSANPCVFVGPDPAQAHVAAFAYRSREAGEALLDEALERLKARGASRVLFGQDSRHFFPGIPKECPEMLSMFQSRGFEVGGLQVDLERDMIDYQPPAGCLERATGCEMRACTREDVPALEEFLLREFPGRWHHDVLDKIRLENRPEMVFGLFVDGVCEGFALTQQEGCRLPISGAVWHLDLGPGWGSLGPIGVSKRVRGKGYGDGILGYALKALRERGARRSTIDWTTLVDFYNKHGFEVNREYQTCVLTLRAPTG